MSVTIELPLEIENTLRREAGRRGESLQAYLLTILSQIAFKEREPGAKSDTPDGEGSVPAGGKRSILELEGVGAELWKDIEPQEYVNQLRSEWDHRL